VLQGLKTPDRLAELLAHANIVDRGVEERLHHPDGICAERCETDVEAASIAGIAPPRSRGGTPPGVRRRSNTRRGALAVHRG